MQLLYPMNVKAKWAAADASPRHKQTSNDARTQRDLQIGEGIESGVWEPCSSF